MLEAPPSLTKMTLTPGTQRRHAAQPLGRVQGLFTAGRKADCGGDNGSLFFGNQQRQQRQQRQRQQQPLFARPSALRGGGGGAGVELQPLRQRRGGSGGSPSASQDAALLRKVVDYSLRQEELHERQVAQQASPEGRGAVWLLLCTAALLAAC